MPARPTALVIGLVLLGGQAQAEVRFHEEGRRRGVDLRYQADLRRAKMIATMGGGLAAADYDRDGDVDLYLLTGITQAAEGTADDGNALYRNDGSGHFEDVAEEAGVDLRDWSMGAYFVDLDGDGWLDLYVTCLGPNRHYRNRGDGTFEEIGVASGLDDDRFGAGAAFADFDRDGDLDVVLVNYLESSIAGEMEAETFAIRVPAEYDGQPAVYFENQGDGTFRDVTARTRTDNEGGKGLGVVVWDADDDGWLDIYIANDTVPNKLYRNQGDGTFEDVSLISGASVSAEGKARAGMGVALGDADGDGNEELFVTNFTSETNSFFYGLGGALYVEETGVRGLGEPSMPYVAWGTAFFDYDLDSDLDLVVANGHLVPGLVRMFAKTNKKEDSDYLKGPWKGPVQLFANRGDGNFEEMAGRAGDLSHTKVAARGLAVLDIEGDGDGDVVVSARSGRSLVFVNRAENEGRHWIVVRPRMPDTPNPYAVGAEVIVEADGRRQSFWIRAGGSYLGSEPFEAHFGLGAATRIERATVRWPDGTEESWTGLPVDQVHRIERGGSTAR